MDTTAQRTRSPSHPNTGKAVRGRSLDVLYQLCAIAASARAVAGSMGFARIEAGASARSSCRAGRFIPAHHHARQRFFPLAAVDLQGLPDRVLAPQRSSTASDLYDAGVITRRLSLLAISCDQLEQARYRRGRKRLCAMLASPIMPFERRHSLRSLQRPFMTR